MFLKLIGPEVKLTEGQVQIYVESDQMHEDGYYLMEEKLMDNKQFEPSMTSEMPIYKVGSGITLTNPGEYVIEFRYPTIAGSTCVYVKVEGTVIGGSTKQKEPNAKPAKSKILVNNKEVAFEAYAIDNSNYFKLRDLAYALDGTSSSCNIAWDTNTQAITIVPGVVYEKTGGELEVGDNKPKEAVPATVKVIKEGNTYELKGYTINGYTYIKVRDVESLLDITVGYNQEVNTVTIDSNSK